MKRLGMVALATVMAVCGLAASTPAHAADFEVTIYNLSNQIFSPPVVVSHRASVSVFEAGDAPSDELAALAEDADAEGLVALLGTVAGVRDVAVGGGVILPGDSATVRVSGNNNSVITILGMMVTTNDTLYSTRIADRRGSSFYGNAYDAGSEANTLSCSHIPGPPCGNGGVRVTEGAEGVIKISEGINRGALRELDWRNPVVKVKVDRADSSRSGNGGGE